MTGNEDKTKADIYANIAAQRQPKQDPQPQQKKNMLNWLSPRLKKPGKIGLGIVAVILLVGFIVVFCVVKTKTAKRTITASNIARVIPDSEVTASYLNRYVSDEAPKKAQEAHKTPVKKQEIIAAPVGSMAIYMAQDSSNSLGSLGLPMGTEFEAVIENTVVAGDRSVPVIARVTQNVMRNGKIVIPKNSRLFGTTSGAIENRLHAKFSRLVLPRGEEKPFSGIAMDRFGGGGIKGRVKRKVGGRTLSVLGSAALGATGVFVPGGAGYGDAFIRGAHRGSMNEVGRDFSHYRSTGASPVITIKGKTKIKIMVDQAI